MIPVYYNFFNLIARKTTALAALFGLALVVFVFASVMMMANGVKKTLGRSGSPDIAIVLRKGADAELSSVIDQADAPLVLAQNTNQPAKGPSGVAESLVVILLDKVGADGFSNVNVRGMPEEGFAFRTDAALVEGRMPKAPDEVLIGKAIRGRFKGLELGQGFELRKNRPVKVVGVFSDRDSSYDSEIWADLATVRSTFGREGYFSSIRLRLQSPAQFDAFKVSLEQNRQLALSVVREPEFYEKQSEGLSLFLNFIGMLVAFFVSVGAMIGAMITMYAQVDSRQRELGTLRALGFSRFQILVSLLLESILLAFAGGIVGASASLLMCLVRVSMLNQQSWSEIVFTFEPTPAILIRAMVAAGVMGLFGGLLPAVRAARISPVEAMRGA